MNKEFVETEVIDKVAWLYLNRPQAMNAINDQLLDQLDSALNTAANDKSIRVIVLTGRGTAFCAGADLKAVAGSNGGSFDFTQLIGRVRRATETFDRIREIDKPVIAAVNGYAVAAGMSLMMACDLIIAARSARIGDGHANFGIVSGSGGTIRLARVVGPVVAKYLAFRGSPVSAAELERFGVINEIVSDDKLYLRVSELADEISRRSPRVLAIFKRIIDDGVEQPAALAGRTARQALTLHIHSSNDMQEGLAAFQEKREPKFED